MLEATDGGAAAGAGFAAHMRRLNDKFEDDISGLAYYGARYYDKTLIGWTQADPLYLRAPDIAKLSTPRRANIGVFSLNNPLRYIDPDGLNPQQGHVGNVSSYVSEMEATSAYRAQLLTDENWEVTWTPPLAPTSGGGIGCGMGMDSQVGGGCGINEQRGGNEDYVPDYVKGLQQDTKWMREAGNVGERIATVASDTGSFIADVAPVIGTVRSFARGDLAGGLIGLGADLSLGAGLVFKVAKVGTIARSATLSRTAVAGNFGRSTVGAAERAIPKFTRRMKSRAEVIAKGRDIRKVDTLVEKFGGTASRWVEDEDMDRCRRGDSLL